MLQKLMELRAKYEKEVVYAQAKLEVTNELIAEFETTEAEVSEETETETETTDYSYQQGGTI